MELLRSASMHDSTLSYLIAAVATYPVRIDVVPQLVEQREGLSPILTGSNNDFEMAQKRGGHLIDVIATELVYLDVGELCAYATGPATKLLETITHALACDTFLNALCKVAGLWHGETPSASAAGLLRAIVGGLDRLGTQKARDFVFALLGSFVSAAVQGCLSAYVELALLPTMIQSIRKCLL
ncbi:hypothetical protein K525DRAFT_202307 [Schizophyllum commune Loenen D]|nr:hypothetical protein K525DRAFT_202307 [Schizophyllum commune Loenen D]